MFEGSHVQINEQAKSTSRRHRTEPETRWRSIPPPGVRLYVRRSVPRRVRSTWSRLGAELNHELVVFVTHSKVISHSIKLYNARRPRRLTRHLRHHLQASPEQISARSRAVSTRIYEALTHCSKRTRGRTG